MVATEQRRFGTFDLVKANGIFVSTWNEAPLVEAQFASRTDGLGSIGTVDAIVGREVRLKGEVTGSGDADTVRGNLDAFMAALYNGEDYLQLFDSRRLLCRMTEFDYRYMDGTEYARVEWDLTLRSRYPTWEATSAVTDSVSIVAGTTGSLAMPANVGVAMAWPEIAITNDGSSFSGLQIILTNTSTGAQLSLDGAQMSASQTMTVSMLDRTVVGDGGVNAIPTMLSSGPSGQFWGIDGSSTQTLGILLSTSASLTFDVTFRARSWSA